jgi:hypothetical protein
MPTPRLVTAFYAMWWVLGATLAFLSVQTVWLGLGSGHATLDVHAVLIGSAEAVAAVLFLVPSVMRVGGIGLLATLAIAFVVHLASGHFAAPLLVYASGVTFVTVHGPVPNAAAKARV